MNDREEEVLSKRVTEAYRRPAPLDPHARERLDLALERMPAPRRRRGGLAWLIEPRPVFMRPGVALAAIVAMLAIGALMGRWGVPTGVATRAENTPGAENAPRAPFEAASRPQVVQFVLVAPRASRVAVVGDFNGWDATATPMERHGTGDTWTVDVTLPAGRHVYAFVMDGTRWITDPAAPLAPANEFGFRNSVIIVGETSPT